MQQPASNVLDTIGNTPLIRLARASEETGCLILGKAEYMNPGASVKDRAALGIVRDGEQRQQIERGGVIVEGTAGNTGIGLAVVGNALGYRTVIVMPNTQSREKVSTLRAYGAEVIEIPAVPFKNPAHFVHESERVAERLRATENHGVLWAN
ncbi:MAG: pyridoxal-phosphate dependent enzyme, partial [Gammaproteobacteria bacterium]|nr:pyridoxal-phosphate dependent enzyme [Gammaproteobacteria bacterium]